MGARLVNIHGQHDNQILLSPERHVQILDNYGALHTEREAYHAKFRELSSAIRKLRAVSGDDAARSRRAELLKFQIEEICAARLTPGLEEELLEKSHRFQNVERLARTLDSVCTALLGDDDDSPGAVDLLSSARDGVLSLSDFGEFAPAAEALEGISLEAAEWASNLHARLSGLEYDQQEADRVEARLSELHTLKLKYGGTVSEILDYLEDARQELSELLSASMSSVCAFERVMACSQKGISAEKPSRTGSALLISRRSRIWLARSPKKVI